MKHSFDVEIAKEYGVHAAVILENVSFWVERSTRRKENFYNGDYWMYGTKKSFSERLPYLTPRQVEIALKKLIDGGIIETGNFNKQSYDRTLWYSITDKGKIITQSGVIESTKSCNTSNETVESISHFRVMEDTFSCNGINGNVGAIPILSDTKKDTKGNTVQNTNSDFERWWAVYPKKVGKRQCEKIFVKIKVPVDTLISATNRQKQSTQWTKDGGQYIPNPATWLNRGGWEDELTQQEEYHGFNSAGNSGKVYRLPATVTAAELDF